MLELPEISGGDFEEILEDLKKQIPALCPEWSNLSESSPGIMLLELLTYICLEQRKSMNKIGGGALINLGRLLGFTPERLAPSHAAAALCGASPKGRKLRVASLVFETERDFTPTGSSVIMYGRCDSSGGIIPVCRVNEKTPPQRLFAGGSGFVIGFDKPLEEKRSVGLYLCFDARGRKYPAEVGEPPWGSIVRWQYYSKNGWRDVEMISDGTLSCYRSGELSFRVGSAHERLSGVFPVRCAAVENRFDLLPVLTGAYPDSCPVRQTDTKCDSVTFGIEEFRANRMVFRHALAESGVYRLMINSAEGWRGAEDMNIAFDVTPAPEGFRLATSSRKELAELFEGIDGGGALMLVMYEHEYVRDFTSFFSDGSSNQRIALNFSGVFACETKLMAAREKDGALFWDKWDYSATLSAEPPEARCFGIGKPEESLVFGDKLHGAIPQKCGGKSVMLTTLRLTSGSAGNICPAKCEGGAEIVSAASGGCDEDTPESFLARVLNSRQPRTLLTLPDYEKAAMETEGILLRSAEAYCTKDRAGKTALNSVTLLAEPVTDRADNSAEGLDWYIDMIKRRLDELRTINTRVIVKFPRYIPISVELSMEASRYAADAGREARERIKLYFSENSGGIIDAAKLTKALSELPGISAVRSLKLSEPALNGSFAVPKGSRAFLDGCEIYCTDRR